MTQATSHRMFEPGTAGWTVDDFYDLDSQRLLPEGRFEIIDGVLTEMAPQGFESIEPLSLLRDFINSHLKATGQSGLCYHEVDLLLRRNRIVRPDMVFLTADQRTKQKQLQQERKVEKGRYHPIYVTPLLIVESVTVGSEKHDRITKREWYAAAGVPHYWILTAHERSVVCLMLEGKHYAEESSAVGIDLLRSSIFGGVSIPLASVWAEE